MPKSHVQSSENQDFHKIWCWLYRTVRPAVEAESTTLFPVLEFVFDRTLACGKTWEVIRLFQFSENLTLHRNTISRNIKRLVALGVILTRNPKHGRAIYAINLNWTDTDMMKIPKRGRTEAPVIPLSEIGRMAAEKAAEAKKKKQRKLSFDAVSSLWASLSWTCWEGRRLLHRRKQTTWRCFLTPNGLPPRVKPSPILRIF